MEIQLREIARQDAESVNRLSGQLGYHLSVEETKNQIEQVITSKDHSAFVAETNSKIVGWIHGFVVLTIESKPFVEIGGLIIDHDYRNKGVGKNLVRKIKDWAVQRKIDSLRVRSNITRKESHTFYSSIGFIEIKTQKVYKLSLQG